MGNIDDGTLPLFLPLLFWGCTLRSCTVAVVSADENGGSPVPPSPRTPFPPPIAEMAGSGNTLCARLVPPPAVSAIAVSHAPVSAVYEICFAAVFALAAVSPVGLLRRGAALMRRFGSRPSVLAAAGVARIFGIFFSAASAPPFIGGGAFISLIHLEQMRQYRQYSTNVLRRYRQYSINALRSLVRMLRGALPRRPPRPLAPPFDVLLRAVARGWLVRLVRLLRLLRLLRQYLQYSTNVLKQYLQYSTNVLQQYLQYSTNVLKQYLQYSTFQPIS